MKNFKHKIIAVLIILFAFMMTACDSFVINIGSGTGNRNGNGKNETIKIAENLETAKSKASKYYDMSDEEKDAYDTIFNGIMNAQTSIKLDGAMTSEEIEDIFYTVKYTAYYSANFPVEYSMYTGSTDSVLQIDFPYPLEDYQGFEKQKKLENKVAQIRALINPNASDYEKIKFIHDYIITNCTYQDGASQSSEDINYFTAYGALVEGRAVCEGYAKAFALLCNDVGVEAFCVVGDAGGAHMWNMVKCDGKWYNMDVTWDDPTPDVGKVSYAYFNVTDEQIAKTHTVGDNLALNRPSAKATSKNYFVTNNLLASDYDEAKKILQQEAQNVLQKNENVIQIKLLNQRVLNDTVNGFFNQQQYYSIMDLAAKSVNINRTFQNVSYTCDEEQFLITITL